MHGRARGPGRPPPRSPAGRRIRPHRWDQWRADWTAPAPPAPGRTGGDAGRCRARAAAPAPGRGGGHRRLRPSPGPPAPPRPPTSMGEWAAALRPQFPPVVPPPFPLVRDRVIPLLKRTAALPPLTGYVHENRMVRRTLDDQISIVYVIEGHHRMTLVTEAMPEAWQITLDELQQLAVRNLRARTRHILDEIGGPRAEYVSLDGFDAARLLVADLMVPPGVDDPLLPMPHEHACLIAPTAERHQIARRAQSMFETSRVPLTSRLYRPSPSGPVPDL